MIKNFPLVAGRCLRWTGGGGRGGLAVFRVVSAFSDKALVVIVFVFVAEFDLVRDLKGF